MHSQALRNGDMYSITRAKFLGSAPFPEDCIYHDGALLSHQWWNHGLLQAHLFTTVLLLCLVDSHLGCLMIHHWPTAIPPSTPCLRCRRLESTTRAVILSVVHFSPSGFPKVLVWHLCRYVLASFWTSQSRFPLFSLVLAASRMWRHLQDVRPIRTERPSL